MSAIGHIRSPPCPNRRHSRLRGPNAPPIRPAGPTRRQPTSSCCNLASALPQAKTCANRVVTTRCQPVVTKREMPHFPWADHGLPLVTAQSDALKSASNPQTVQRDLPQARTPRTTTAEAPSGAPGALGQGLNPMNLQQQAPSVPMPRAAAARKKTSAQNGSGVPSPL